MELSSGVDWLGPTSPVPTGTKSTAFGASTLTPETFGSASSLFAMGGIEALYIFDEQNALVLSHIWTGRPPSAQVLLPLFTAHPEPRPSLIYESSTNPPTLVHSIVEDRLLYLCPTSNDTDPLIVLEFLHRIVDVFEDFLGTPLLASKISSSYDVIAQLLSEMCDSGAVATTEPNALRDLVEAPSWMNKLLGGVGLPSASPALPATQSLGSMGNMNPNTPAILWRRNNVRHTSNELYVDIVETLHVISAPSGQPLAATSHGSVVFTAKVSGVPDLFLSLTSQAGGPTVLAKTLRLPVFHPCVRLQRWKDRPGDLSFVPPDGRFLLMGYEVDLLGPEYLERALATASSNTGHKKRVQNSPLQLPATVSIAKSLGPNASDFEVRLHINPSFAARAGTGVAADAFSKATGKNSGTSAHPTVEDVVVSVPIPGGVRGLGDLRASRGEARWAPGEDKLEWRVSGKQIGTLATGLRSSGDKVVATLRCSITAATENNDDAGDEAETSNLLSKDQWAYDEDEGAGYQSSKDVAVKSSVTDQDARDRKRRRANEALMPSSASVSFQVKGWLASGIKVDKLLIDALRSRGVSAGVQPYKGVKYVTVSQHGVETRC
jgi:AP-3 complex subunit mu